MHIFNTQVYKPVWMRFLVDSSCSSPCRFFFSAPLYPRKRSTDPFWTRDPPPNLNNNPPPSTSTTIPPPLGPSIRTTIFHEDVAAELAAGAASRAGGRLLRPGPLPHLRRAGAAVVRGGRVGQGGGGEAGRWGRVGVKPLG